MHRYFGASLLIAGFVLFGLALYNPSAYSPTSTTSNLVSGTSSSSSYITCPGTCGVGSGTGTSGGLSTSSSQVVNTLNITTTIGSSSSGVLTVTMQQCNSYGCTIQAGIPLNLIYGGKSQQSCVTNSQGQCTFSSVPNNTQFQICDVVNGVNVACVAGTMPVSGNYSVTLSYYTQGFSVFSILPSYYIGGALNIWVLISFGLMGAGAFIVIIPEKNNR